MNRAALVLLLLGACVSTSVSYEGELVVSDPLREPNVRRTRPLQGSLTEVDLRCSSSVSIDRRFESCGFDLETPVFVRTAGDSCVLQVRTDATVLLVSMPDAVPGAHTSIVPYFAAVRATDETISALVCKGGTGRVTLDTGGGGSLSLRLTCRTYANGQEREESTIEIAGRFAD